jgi:CHAT domain-containing protein
LSAPHKFRPVFVIIGVLCLLSLAPAQNESPDDAALAALIKSYYAALAQKDLAALVSLWSERSPDLISSIEEAQRSHSIENRSFSDILVSSTRIAGNKALLRVESNTTVTNIQSNATSVGRSIRNFALVKEGTRWKVWREAPGSEDLSPFLEKGSEWKVSRDTIQQFANVIVASQGDELNKLLADNNQMITAELREALIRRVGPQLATKGGYEAALRILQIALVVAERADDREGIAIVNREMGDALRALGRLPQALERYQNALTQFAAMGRKSDRAATLVSIGQIHFEQRNHDRALESYTSALADYEDLKNTRSTANTLEELASVYYEQEVYDRALELFERCLKLRETFATRAEISATLNSIGNVYLQRLEYDAAIQRYREALAGFEALKDADAIVSTMSNIGSAAYAQGDADTALGYYQKALTLQERLRDRFVAASLRMNIATVYSSQGNYSPALDSLRKAAAIFEALKSENKFAGALSEIGDTYFQVHQFSLALEHYQKSVKLYEKLNSLADSSMALYAIGNIQLVIGNYDAAIDSYQNALAQFQAIKHAPGVASMLASIGGVYYAQQKYDLALEFYQKSLASYEVLADKTRGAGVIERIASVYYSQGEYARSLEWAARALTTAEQTASFETLWRARLTQGLAFRALNQTDEAAQSFGQSIAIIESMRARLVRGERDAQRFFQSKNTAYLAMMEALIAQNKVSEAFVYAERMRANTLLDILQRAPITKSLAAPEQEQERRVQNSIAAIKTQLAHERERKRPDEARLNNLDGALQKALRDYRELETRLYAGHPRLKTLRGEGSPITPEDACALLTDSSTAAVEFVVADTRTYLFVLTRNGAGRRSPSVRTQTQSCALNSYVVNISRGQIAGRVTEFRDKIARRDETVQETARALYDLLLAPAAGQLAGKTTLLIVPDDVLWQLPFEALQQPDNHYFIEDHAVAYAPSLTALAEMVKPRAPAGEVHSLAAALFADPVISKQTLDRLTLTGEREKLDTSPESESEARSFERIYGSARSKVYLGAEANEANVKQEANKFSVIHFAAPALFFDSSPLYSHVTLSPPEEGGNGDGLLETWEIMKLNLQADLIVFSATDIAYDRTSPGDAITGLSWSMFIAGCPASLVSRWRGEPSATGVLMSEFHRELQSSLRTASRARALQVATLRILRGGQYRHPYFWAGFALVGNAR